MNLMAALCRGVSVTQRGSSSSSAQKARVTQVCQVKLSAVTAIRSGMCLRQQR